MSENQAFMKKGSFNLFILMFVYLANIFSAAVQNPDDVVKQIKNHPKYDFNKIEKLIDIAINALAICKNPEEIKMLENHKLEDTTDKLTLVKEMIQELEKALLSISTENCAKHETKKSLYDFVDLENLKINPKQELQKAVDSFLLEQNFIGNDEYDDFIRADILSVAKNENATTQAK